MSNGLEYYHDELIGSRALLYEGCELTREFSLLVCRSSIQN